MSPSDTPMDVTVQKRNPENRVTWEYRARVLERGPAHIVLEAPFDREDTLFHEVTLRRGDRFVEMFFSDRWYNIFAVHDRDDDRLKVWYCNIGMPALITDQSVSYIDLALDLLVYPDGRMTVLDEDEFEQLSISPEQRAGALSGLAELREYPFLSRQP